MSRHAIPGKNPAHDVVVGWDPPLQTYFCIILDPSKDEDDGGYTVLWVGADRPREVVTAVELQDKVRGFAIIPQDVFAQLMADRRDNK